MIGVYAAMPGLNTLWIMCSPVQWPPILPGLNTLWIMCSLVHQACSDAAHEGHACSDAAHEGHASRDHAMRGTPAETMLYCPGLP